MSNDPIVVAHVPHEVLTAAKSDKRIITNPRQTSWSEHTRSDCLSDYGWQSNLGQYSGHLLHPQMTDFLLGVVPEMILAILCQEAAGRIVTVVSPAIGRVSWLAGNDFQDLSSRYGVDGKVLLEDRKFRCGVRGQFVWAGWILAAARLSKVTQPSSQIDLDGSNFLELVRKFGVDSEIE